MADRRSGATGRREPPAFRELSVVRTEALSARMVRVTLTGELDGMVIDEPAASVRLLLPAADTGELVIPVWTGNEFLLADGTRPVIRTFTPRRFDPDALRLDLDLVIHRGGVASAWATNAQPGDRAAVSGPGRGYSIDRTASGFLLVGDETAIPAIAQLIEVISTQTAIMAHIELDEPWVTVPLPSHPRLTVNWAELASGSSPGDEIVAAVEAADIDNSTRIWCAGEAAAMHRIRTHLFKERQIPRSQATVRGYWKRDRAESTTANRHS